MAPRIKIWWWNLYASDQIYCTIISLSLKLWPTILTKAFKTPCYHNATDFLIFSSDKKIRTTENNFHLFTSTLSKGRRQTIWIQMDVEFPIHLQYKFTVGSEFRFGDVQYEIKTGGCDEWITRRGRNECDPAFLFFVSITDQGLKIHQQVGWGT